MTPEQFERLAQLSEKLADVAIEEGDPDAWPGAGRPLSEITKQERGDRFWCKKNASATFALLVRVDYLMGDHRENMLGEPAQDMEEQIGLRERQAARLLREAMERARRTPADAKPASP